VNEGQGAWQAPQLVTVLLTYGDWRRAALLKLGITQKLLINSLVPVPSSPSVLATNTLLAPFAWISSASIIQVKVLARFIRFHHILPVSFDWNLDPITQ
jgi:hypothetical protein